jgi:hypothetical protein
MSALEHEELAGASDPLRHVLELPWPSRVRSVRVAGRELYRDGDFPTLPPAPARLSAMRAELAASAIRFASRG